MEPKIITVALMFLLGSGSSALAADESSMRLKFFGRPTFESLYGKTFRCPGPPMTAAEIQQRLKTEKLELAKERERQHEQNTLKYWFAANYRPLSEQDKSLFEHEAVSCRVTFDEGSDIGTVRLSQCGSDAANKAALEIIQRLVPFTTPPNDMPYRRGLLIRFSQSKMTVQLGPRPFA
jgi:hypothetical protein